jgi:ATP-dependent DNA helicase RecQ
VAAVRTRRDPEDVLREHFGYPGFRPGQRDLVDAVLAGRDAIGILPTGGGKSVCYQVPAFLLPGVTVVVTPLVSLMEDQLRRARELGLAADALHSGLPDQEQEAVVRRLTDGAVKLIFVAPERFESRAFREVVPRVRASLIAVDEAHCISMWGHDFRPSYGNLGSARAALGTPVMALTATATPRVRRDIEQSLGLRKPARVIGSFDRPNLRWGVRPAPRSADRTGVVRAYVRRAPGARLVYAATRRRVEAIRHALARRGLPAEAYHAGLSPRERSRVQAHFLGAPAPVVVATNAFGMGIDRPDVRLVVHDQLPGSLEAYYQEAGRAGRDGAPASCLALYAPEDGTLHRRFLSQSHPPTLTRVHGAGLRGLVDGVTSIPQLIASKRRRKVGLDQIRGVSKYATAAGCRRAALLAWFGEASETRSCDRCDRCATPGVLEPWRPR